MPWTKQCMRNWRGSSWMHPTILRAKSVALECQTIFDAYDYVKDFDVERDVRDALLLPIIGGSSAMQRNNIFKWFGVTA